MARAPHPNEDIEQALQYAESKGWRVEKSGKSAHCWGLLKCPTNNHCRGGIYCIKSIWSTPKNPSAHGREITRVVDKCEVIES